MTKRQTEADVEKTVEAKLGSCDVQSNVFQSEVTAGISITWEHTKNATSGAHAYLLSKKL